MNNTPRSMLVPRPIILLAMPMALTLAACVPTTTEAASAPATVVATANPAPAPGPVTPVTPVEPASSAPSETLAAGSASASISGAIRNGNRPPPALRVCATPIDGGIPTCIETAEGAREYRLDVAPGRYYVLGWADSGELTLIAHASQIRCIRAPCPPDALIEVGVAAGQRRDGIDLNGGYVDIPEGWPKRPA